MAQCLRHVYMGDPFGSEPGCVQPPPKELFDQVSVREVEVSGTRCVLYEPSHRSSSLPLIIYMHGGGFVVASSEDSDYTTRKLCYTNKVVVLSVNYRLSPETMFPGAIEDCLAVLDWAVKNWKALGVDLTRIFVCGDSAGGNLAVALAMRMRERGRPAKGLVLLAPWLDMNLEQYDSYNRLAPTGIVYDAAFMGYARSAYAHFHDWSNKFVSPILFDPAHWPPTLVLVGDDDPLVDQCRRLAERALADECNQIEVVVYPGMPHCFYSFANLFAEELDCFERIARFITKHLK